MAPSPVIAGPEAYRTALRKATFGRNDWIWWRDANGCYAARKSPETIKSMLLAVGTRGPWTLICAGGTPLRGFWWLGINALAQARRGW
jgi:hypothetical protein